MSNWLVIAFGFAVVALGNFARRQARSSISVPHTNLGTPENRLLPLIGFVVLISAAALISLATIDNNIVRLSMSALTVIAAIVTVIKAGQRR
jgi:hypothetical protein